MDKLEIKKMLWDMQQMIDGFDRFNAQEIGKQIKKEIRENFDNYEVDFILETWTEFGYAPNLIYDDNGMFAVVETAFAPAVYGANKIDGSIVLLVKKKHWKPTIRKALWKYIKKD
jgi:hypothetical protein